MRTFYDVGDALFAVEEVSNLFFVYDCGSNSNNQAKAAIERAFPVQGQTVEAVFISHFDRDHINGVHFLLSHCKVKVLILPLLPPFAAFYLLHENELSDEDRDFILNTVNYVGEKSRDTRIIHILDSDETTNSDQISASISDLASKNSTVENYPSGLRINLYSENWMFIPWNIQIMSEDQKRHFIDKFKSLCIENDIEPEDIQGLWKKIELCEDSGPHRDNMLKKAVADFIERLKGHDINSLSLTLYSGPIEPEFAGKIGCLYLGDYNAKKFFSKLKDAYNSVWSSIGLILVPHHGSPENYNPDLIDENTLSVVSLKLPATNKKRYNTLNEILQKKGIILATGYRGDVKITHMVLTSKTGTFHKLLLCDDKGECYYGVM
ncbi:MBL fold metallo-hydrolase [Bacteroides sp. 51]|uniref:MBL fold metallo-hydrolase n=1 Tax=Bacteroides sp. 51 TaxID=2302938 RepID=UPI0013D0D99B|nr:MBL fold metallo-hydrolase [Bacteroides sp. 51]NDV80828.1 MBL fold metallo-hydrolase [Bacteroides sp. 51]